MLWHVLRDFDFVGIENILLYHDDHDCLYNYGCVCDLCFRHTFLLASAVIIPYPDLNHWYQCHDDCNGGRMTLHVSSPARIWRMNSFLLRMEVMQKHACRDRVGHMHDSDASFGDDSLLDHRYIYSYFVFDVDHRNTYSHYHGYLMNRHVVFVCHWKNVWVGFVLYDDPESVVGNVCDVCYFSHFHLHYDHCHISLISSFYSFCVLVLWIFSSCRRCHCRRHHHVLSSWWLSQLYDITPFVVRSFFLSVLFVTIPHTLGLHICDSV